eukprot:TRINITY_DN3762_c0_g1_i1.p1 TRINITY_DN3762_c0_g1~~TRINITY_DN3762_c0_g1_i1.p1  ORF type:complete len:244 (+),score=64.90 TRINITY_DN3762_c0_g1_i1:186-917(+)
MTWEINGGVEASLGAVGTLAAVLMFFSPVTTIQRIMRNKSTEEFSPFPFVSTLLNCSVWVVYSLPSVTPNRSSLLVTNFLGAAAQVFFVAVFAKFAKDRPKQLLQQLLGVYGTAMAVLFVLISYVLPADNVSTVVGFMGMILTVVMFAAPLSAVAVVMRTGNVDFMPLSLTVMALICSIVWSMYGAYVRDVYVLVPNALGVLLGLIQLSLYIILSQRPGKGGALPSAYSVVEISKHHPASANN